MTMTKEYQRSIKRLFKPPYVITAIVWVLTGILLLTRLTVLGVPGAGTGQRKTYDIEQIEVLNTLEDMAEWLEWDISEGSVDSAQGYEYLLILQQSICELTENQTETEAVSK